jgi:hypothetical protein
MNGDAAPPVHFIAADKPEISLKEVLHAFQLFFRLPFHTEKAHARACGGR